MQPQPQQPRIDPTLAGGDWSGYGVVSGPAFLALCQQDKVSFLFGNDSVLLWVQRADGVAGVYRLVDTPVQPAPAQPSTTELSSELDKLWGFKDLLPLFQKYGQQYGFDYKVLTSIAYQESGFRNWRVHMDGTGFGLFGLDDNGLLPDFEQWSGIQVGRGAAHQPVSPNKQIEYAAMQLAKYQQALGGDPILASQAWHRGMGAYQDDLGQAYGNLIRAHIKELFPSA